MATYDGTPDDDVIMGSMEDDILLGGAGDDELSGMDGDDRLEGGPGADVLEGGAGADEIDGGDDDGLGEFFGSSRNLVWGDTATYVHSDAGVTINLATGTAEGGHAEGDTLTDIESIRGSDHADVLVARNDDPSTPGTSPETQEGSTLYGQGGDDSLTGGDGRDYLWGGKGSDTLVGGANIDYLEGGAGADVLDGGEGLDYAKYELSDAGVTVNLATGQAEGGHAEGDTLTGIEWLWGSSHADRLTGDDGLNIFVGGAGADTLDGGGGSIDLTYYSDSKAGVTVNLATGTGQGGYAEGDLLRGIERVFGSRHADHLIGGDDDAQLFGWFGDDTLEGGAGNDWFEGGAGADVIDGGGGDWNFAAYWNSDAGVTINLAEGEAAGGHAEGDTLTGIIGVVGSNHADHLLGDDVHNNLQGGDGDDTLEGGGDGDWLRGGAGSDMLVGGAGDDTARYNVSDAGVTVNLATGTAQGGNAEGDTLTSIESISGSDHADHLIGDAENNSFWGRDGDDTLDGGGGDDHLQGDTGDDMLDGGVGNDYLVGGEGADVLDGGAGYDTADYGASDAGVSVNLTRDRAEGGHAGGDRLTGIEELRGSSHADRLIGNGRDNNLQGGDGDDTLISGAGNDQLHGGAGADRLDGGDGDDDWARYWGSDAGVTVNLATGTGQGGHAEGDTLIRVERVAGSDHADHLIGDDGDNGFDGGTGADTIDGGEGDDFAGYWGSDAGVTVNLTTGTGLGGHAEGDTLIGIESIYGSRHDDHLIGSDEDDTLNGEAGADTLDGSEGYDNAGYWGSDAGVTVDLTTGTGLGGHAEGDTLIGIESISGSYHHADHLIGDDRDNRLNGNGGNDTLEGGDGDDWLNGEDGEDLLTGGGGADTFVFGDGDTVTDFEDGSDLINIHDFGHINADNFETNVTIRQSGDDVESPDWRCRADVDRSQHRRYHDGRLRPGVAVVPRTLAPAAGPTGGEG